MVDFAGWSMPVQFTSIVQEHTATRTAVGVFDISHMGRLRLHGEGVPEFLDRLVTRRVRKLKPGGIRYGLVINERGGILDDVLVYHLADPQGQGHWSMVVNAGNRQKIVQWLQAHLPEDGSVQLDDQTRQTAMIAVQGPAAVSLASSLLPLDIASLRYYSGAIVEVDGQHVLVSRTGYTGEDGCELIMGAELAASWWERILDAGQPLGAEPVGLGARDTLRLEAAMPLYGHELSEAIHPLQAGLDFAVQLKDHDFIGRTALVAAQANPDWPRRVGLVLQGRRAARQQYPVRDDGQIVGHVTSGSWSPTLQQSIAMAYVEPEYQQPGTRLLVDVRGRSADAEVVALPFYQRGS
jgi:aminomethyltransferase